MFMAVFESFERRGRMVSHRATWTTRTGVRWFVRITAVLVGLANLGGVIIWFVGGLYVLGGESESSLSKAIPSVIAVVLSGLATSQIVLRAFELPGRGFWHRYSVVAMSVCIGGAIEGGLLACVFSLDGTLFPEPPPGFYAEHPLLLFGGLGYIMLVGLLGAGIGFVIGLAEGLILGLPLAAMLGTLGDN
jgi:hypothetical protein